MSEDFLLSEEEEGCFQPWCFPNWSQMERGFETENQACPGQGDP